MWVWAVSFAWRASAPRTAGGIGAAAGVSRFPFPLSRSSNHPCSANSSSSPSCVRLPAAAITQLAGKRSEEHTSELQSQSNLVCRLLLEKKKKNSQILPSHVTGNDAHEP